MFPYMGGKCHHIKHLDAIFPQNVTTFVDVFGGAGWVSTKTRCVSDTATIVYNDYSPYMANIFRHMSTNTAALVAELDSTVRDSDTYIRYRDSIFAEQHDPQSLAVAVRWLYMLVYSFSGNTLNAKSKPYFDKTIDKLTAVKNKLRNTKTVQRLQRLTVENLDFEEVIRKYDSPNTFFYCDPPYYNLEHYYKQEFNDHKRLANVLNTVRGRVAVSYYEFDELNQWYPNWKRHSYTLYKPSSFYGNRKSGTELVLTNY